MRGGRDERHHPYLIGLWLIGFLLTQCSNHPPAGEELARATSSFRRGDYRAAESLAEKGLESTKAQPQSIVYWNYLLVRVESLINLGRAKDALPLLDAAPPDKPGFEEVRCRTIIVRAKALFRSGRANDASATLDEAESLATALQLKALFPEIQIFRYALFETLNQPQKAETALQEALKLARERKDSYWETLALNNLGYSRLRRSRYDEALSFLRQAESGFLKFDAKLLASAAQVNIAACERELGDFDRALASYNSAIDIQQREGAKPFLQASLGEVGNLYASLGDFTKAIAYDQQALALALEINALSDASKWSGNLAITMITLGNWDQAEKFNEQSTELKKKTNDVDSQINSSLHSAMIAAGREDNVAAEKLFRNVIQSAGNKPSILWEAHGELGRLYRRLGDRRKAAEHFDAAIRIIEASRAELSLPENRITFLARLISFYQSYVDALIEQKDYDKALQIADSSRARVLLEKIGRVGTQSSPTLPAPHDPKSVVLSYWLAPQRSFLWVITARGRRLFILPPGKEIESQVEAYLKSIQDLRDPLESPQPAAEHLYQTLLAPARELIPDDARVVVVPDGALHNLNFETLPVPGKIPHYWIEDAVVSVAPSLAVRPDSDLPVSLKSILIVGNPESPGEEFPKLPHAAEEMQSVERRMNTLQQTVFEGTRAEPAAYGTSNPEQFSVIHFTTHASANNASPMESAIILSPANDAFKLYARDVAQLPLKAELVTISACRGAGARVYSGEGLVGFTWAFLQAGAHHVIAGLWDVSDSSTAQLMDSLYENLNQSRSPAQALREAKLKLIHSQSNFKKPYYWAPFQVYVGSGTR